jgi:hypothetical protein
MVVQSVQLFGIRFSTGIALINGAAVAETIIDVGVFHRYIEMVVG